MSDPVLDALDAFIANLGGDQAVREEVSISAAKITNQEPVEPDPYLKTIIHEGISPSTSAARLVTFREPNRPLNLPPKRLDLAPLAPALENIEFFRASSETLWHLDHGERVPRALCAGCRAPFMPGDDALDLADDNRVHFAADHRCLIAWGERWRSAARAAVGIDEVPE